MFCPRAKLHCLLNDHSFSLRISVLFSPSYNFMVCTCVCVCMCVCCSRLLSVWACAYMISSHLIICIVMLPESVMPLLFLISVLPLFDLKKPSATIFTFCCSLLIFFSEVLYPYMPPPPLQPCCGCVVCTNSSMHVCLNPEAVNGMDLCLQFLYFTINGWWTFKFHNLLQKK